MEQRGHVEIKTPPGVSKRKEKQKGTFLALISLKTAFQAFPPNSCFIINNSGQLCQVSRSRWFSPTQTRSCVWTRRGCFCYLSFTARTEHWVSELVGGSVFPIRTHTASLCCCFFLCPRITSSQMDPSTAARQLLECSSCL